MSKQVFIFSIFVLIKQVNSRYRGFLRGCRYLKRSLKSSERNTYFWIECFFGVEYRIEIEAFSQQKLIPIFLKAITSSKTIFQNAVSFLFFLLFLRIIFVGLSFGFFKESRSKRENTISQYVVQKLKSYNKMDKKLGKRSFKSPSSYFNTKGKKGKRSLMFSAASVPALKVNQEDTFKKYSGNNCQPLKTNRNFNESNHNREAGDKGINTQVTKEIKHSFKIHKDQNKISKSLMKNTDYWWKQKKSKFSLERNSQSPKVKFDSQVAQTKPSDELYCSRSMDIDGYEKQIKKLRNSVNRYKKMHEKSLKKLIEFQEKTKEDELKFQRTKNIYIQQIKNLTRNLRSNKNVLGHLFTYNEIDKNIVPENIILEVSTEDKSFGGCDLEILEEYYQCWKGNSQESESVSQISVDSRIALE